MKNNTHIQSVMEEFNEAVKKQNNNGNPYFPDWDSVKNFIKSHLNTSYNQGREEERKKIKEIKDKIIFIAGTGNAGQVYGLSNNGNLYNYDFWENIKKDAPGWEFLEESPRFNPPQPINN